MPADSGPPSPPGGPPVPPGSAAGATDLVGTVLAGRYRILEKLGEGAMGAVYLAEHIRIGRKDAIKVLRGPMARDPEAVARFTRGARNVSAIRHPNVCAIYDFSDTSDGLQFMAMEYVPGATLKDILERDGKLAPPRAAWIAKQVADALQAAHEVDIVHRDLKPGNIMVAQGPDGRDRVKVVDFDIAKGPRDGEASEVTRLGFVVGTPEYMSPEQLMGEHLDGRSDIYSLALVTFRALTGSLPFRADNIQDLALKRLTDTPLRLDEAAPGQTFAPGLQAVVSRGLQRRPADRYPSAAEFGRDLLAAVEGATPASAATAATAPPPGAPELPATRVAAATSAPASGPRGRRPSRRVLLAGGAVAVVGVVGITALLLSHGASPNGSGANARPAGARQAPSTSVTGDGSQTGNPTRPVANSSTTPASNGATKTGSASTAASPPTRAGGAGNPAPAGAGRNPPVEAGGTSTGGATPPAADRAGASGGAASGARGSGIAVTAGNAHALLSHQMDAISLASAPLGASALRAIEDTARAVWNGGGVSDADRAFAAYIMGNVLVSLGDTTGAVNWLQRAVSLRPDERGYRQMLDAYRKPRP